MKLKDILKPEHIITGLRSKNKEKILEQMVDKIDLPDVSKQIIFQTIKQRELMGSTGIGKGIAIPHARSIILRDLYLYIGISKKGVDFNSTDKKPVHLIFLILAPPQDRSNRYLILLGKIAQMAPYISKNMDKILKLKTQEEIYKALIDIDDKIK